MKIVIAPDSYKESLTAVDVSKAIYDGFSSVFPTASYVVSPVGDGGEGTLDAMIVATNGRKISVQVTGPLGDKIQASWGLLGDQTTAYIEMAEASGLEKISNESRNPLHATSRGTGELIIDALNYGIKEFIIGIGGSATNDAGLGMLQALGYSFLDENDKEIGSGGGYICDICRIDLSGVDSRLRECNFIVASDVTNPFVGENGATKIFGPQKGATPEMVEKLEFGFLHYCKIVEEITGKDIRKVPGGGAAGGMGASLIAFLNAKLTSGIDIVLNTIGFDLIASDASLIITGEGKLDSQSIYGKVPSGIALLAKKYNIPVIGIGGSLSDDVDIVHNYGIDAVFSSIHKICTLDDALKNAYCNIYRESRNIAATIKIGMSII